MIKKIFSSKSESENHTHSHASHHEHDHASHKDKASDEIFNDEQPSFCSKHKYWIIGAIVLLVALGIFAALLFSNTAQQKAQELTSNSQDRGAVIAQVSFNNKQFNVYANDFNQMKQIAQAQQLELNDSYIVKRLAEIEVLKEQASILGIQVTDAQVQEQVQSQLKLYKSQGLDQALQVQNVTLEQFTLRLAESIKLDLTLRQLLAQEVVSQINISDDFVKNVYEANLSQYYVPQEVNVSHILICYEKTYGCKSNITKEEALAKMNEAIEKLKQGASFAQVAQEYSTDAGSAPYGGEVGLIQKGQTVTEFEQVAFTTKIGDISSPFTTMFGYHILRVNGAHDEYIRSFSEVKDALKAQIYSVAASQLTVMYVDKLMQNATVTPVTQ